MDARQLTMSSTGHLEGHTFQRFDGELNHVHLMMLQMGGLVYDQARSAIDSIEKKNLDLARLVLERESQVDALEKEIDGEITATLAKRGPLARDLRGLMAFSKAVADLERIGDDAVRIAEIAKLIHGKDGYSPAANMMRDVHYMGKLICNHLRESLDIFDLLDHQRAETLLKQYGDLDEEFKAGLRRLTTYVMEDGRNVGNVINLVLVLKSLERIGDHAHNLAEYIVFLVSGEDIRHPENSK
jgi:phosphate transport system protein